MATDFEAALTRLDLEAVRRYPKADLHTHAWANSDRAHIREKTGRDIAPVATPLPSMEAMHAWVATNIGDLFDGPREERGASRPPSRERRDEGAGRNQRHEHSSGHRVIEWTGG
jgi:hypothetical protein